MKYNLGGVKKSKVPVQSFPTRMPLGSENPMQLLTDAGMIQDIAAKGVTVRHRLHLLQIHCDGKRIDAAMH